MKSQVLQGDALTMLRTLDAGSVHCCVTSPPYYALRDYGVPGQIGLESTPAAYVARLVEVFEDVRRVLRADGVLWLNLGDSYASQGGDHSLHNANQPNVGAARCHANGSGDKGTRRPTSGLKPKDLVGIPWMVAFALRDAGWYLRSDIIWSKPNPMPESVTDRPTKSHEYLFLLSKSERYYYDHAAIREPAKYPGDEGYLRGPVEGCDSEFVSWRAKSQAKRKTDKQRGHGRRHAGFNDRWDAMSKEEQAECGRNKRSVWTVATKPYAAAHFATFPPDLIKPCILAGAPEGGTVLDPFAGSGTTLHTANSLCRHAIGIELNGEYVKLIEKRLEQGFLDWTGDEPSTADGKDLI